MERNKSGIGRQAHAASGQPTEQHGDQMDMTLTPPFMQLLPILKLCEYLAKV